MKVILDNREIKLIDECNKLKETFKDVDINVKSLDLGDILIENNEEKTILIIERKSVSDLLSSISDGRYKEQSFRLSGIEHENHNIIYLIEGNIMSLPEQKRKTVHSAILSLNHYKGFSVYRSLNITETAYIVMNMANKINQSKDKVGYYLKQNKVDEDESYIACAVKKKKQDNITEENIFPILLCNIPSISEVTAKAIASKFDNFLDFIDKIRKEPLCLDNITYLTNKNQKRKISKNSIKNIKKFLGI